MAGMIIQEFIKSFIRRKKVVRFPDLERARPVSSLFGIERGLPIDRYYIEKFMKENAGFIKGFVLEIGDNYYTKKYGNTVEGSDILDVSPENKKATIIADLTQLPDSGTNRYDCVICTQTYNFIFKVEKAVEGVSSLLKPGGVLLATAAGISQISRYDMNRWGDFWRFTTASISKLHTPYFNKSLSVKHYGNVLAACAFLQGISVEDLPSPSLLNEIDNDYQLLITVVGEK
jgi:hypothetical protein